MICSFGCFSSSVLGFISQAALSKWWFEPSAEWKKKNSEKGWNWTATPHTCILGQKTKSNLFLIAVNILVNPCLIFPSIKEETVKESTLMERLCCISPSLISLSMKLDMKDQNDLTDLWQSRWPSLTQLPSSAGSFLWHYATGNKTD